MSDAKEPKRRFAPFAAARPGPGASRRLCLLLITAATLTVRQAQGQMLEVLPDTTRATVGDVVGLRILLRQYEGDALLERVPHLAAALPDGVRLLGVDSMRQVAHQRLEARATIAFYRPGPQVIPPLAIDFRRGAVILHGTMRSEPVPIEIVPVLTMAGGATLKDIKEMVTVPGPDPLYLAGVLAALGLAALAWRRRLRRPRTVVAPAPVAEPVPAEVAPDPYAIALDRLAEIARARLADRGQVAEHYQAATDALRDYLEAAEGVPARERTTAELLWSMPPALLEGGLRRQYESLFHESDLVKFARRRPGPAAAAQFLEDARTLLARWQRAHREEPADALR